MKKVIDLFCGAGGLSAGLRKAGFTIKIGVDIDKQALQTYRTNFQRTKILEKDIIDVTGEELRRLANLQADEHEFLLAGCPPCQGFSNLGKRNPDDSKNLLVLQYVRLIEELQPNFILMENVPGMSKSVGKKIFQQVLTRLAPLYHIDQGVLNAADYGVPQLRKRLVLHGVRRPIYDVLRNIVHKENISFLPKPSFYEYPNGRQRKWVCVDDAISDLPPIAAGEKFPENKICNHVTHRLSVTNLKRIKAIRANGGNRQGIDDKYELECHKKVGGGHTDTYCIIDSSRPAPTMTSGCTVISKGRFGHPTQNRALSVREAARLQSFEDDFVFCGSLTAMSLQVGNAVPPKLATASGKVIYKYMAMYEEYLRR